MGDPTSDAGSWLAGVYELNAVGEAWAGFSVLTGSTMRFATKQQACTALAIAYDGDSYSSTQAAAVARARALIRPALINSVHRPGQLVLFVQHVPHLDGTGLITYAASDSARSISAMTKALTPAPDAERARARMLEAVAVTSALPERDGVEDFLEDAFGIAPASPDPAAERAAKAIATLTDDFRGDWYTFVGNTRIGVFHAECWTR